MGMSSTILQVVEESLRYSESRVLVDSGKASWGKGLCKWRPEKAPFWDGGGGQGNACPSYSVWSTSFFLGSV